MSKGRGIYGEPIYGVSVRKSGGGSMEGSKLLYSRRAAENYIVYELDGILV